MKINSTFWVSINCPVKLVYKYGLSIFVFILPFFSTFIEAEKLSAATFILFLLGKSGISPFF